MTAEAPKHEKVLKALMIIWAAPLCLLMIITDVTRPPTTSHQPSPVVRARQPSERADAGTPDVNSELPWGSG